MNGSRGVTLLELVVTMALIGILAAGAAIFLRPTIDAYFATQRRGELADAADTAVRRMLREIRQGLPNSARTTTSGANAYVEVLLTRNGGRYRSANDDDNPAVTAEDILDFTVADSAFDTLGNLPTLADQQVQAGDWIAIHNLGIAGANAYDIGAANPNIAQVQSYASGGGALPNEDRITLAAANRFPLESPGRRFFVVSGPVTFACLPGAVDGQGNGTGVLRRWSGYAIQLAQPTSTPGGATDALLAGNVTACTMRYTNLPLQGRGLVEITVQITRGSEAVNLYYQAHINNVP